MPFKRNSKFLSHFTYLLTN